jgi:hypothetical protein
VWQKVYIAGRVRIQDIKRSKNSYLQDAVAAFRAGLPAPMLFAAEAIPLACWQLPLKAAARAAVGAFVFAVAEQDAFLAASLQRRWFAAALPMLPAFAAAMHASQALASVATGGFWPPVAGPVWGTCGCALGVVDAETMGVVGIDPVST